jgi:hypothetical protein
MIMTTLKAVLKRHWRRRNGHKLLAAIARIEKAAISELQDVDWVTDLVRRTGLKYLPPPSSRVYGADERYMNWHGDGLFQIPRQFARFLVFCGQMRPKTMIEIGTNNGWTASIATAYFRRLCPGFHAVTVDIVDLFFMLSEVEKRLPLKFCLGRTSDDFRGQNFDLCFIDGDHSFAWVCRDYENVGQLARICAFHDIIDSYVDAADDGGSRRHWQGLRRAESAHFVEFTDHSSGQSVMGIGVRARTAAEDSSTPSH